MTINFLFLIPYNCLLIMKGWSFRGGRLAFFQMPDNRVISCKIETVTDNSINDGKCIHVMNTIYYWNYGDEMCGMNVLAILEMNGHQITGCTLHTTDGHLMTHDVMNNDIKLNVYTSDNTYKLVPLIRRKNSDRFYDFPTGTELAMAPCSPKKADPIGKPGRRSLPTAPDLPMTPDLSMTPSFVPDFVGKNLQPSAIQEKLSHEKPHTKLKDRSKRARNKTDKFAEKHKFEQIIEEYRPKNVVNATMINEDPQITKLLRWALQEKIKSRKNRRNKKRTKNEIRKENLEFEFELQNLDDID